MSFNAYVLDWTIDGFEDLKDALSAAGFAFRKEADSAHIRVTVPFARAQDFAVLCQPRLNAPCNYIDVQFPDERQTALIFRQKMFLVSSREENERVKQWALAQGLPPEQSDWGTSF
jgi:hypothetical protein